jgi:hypothetical protein
VGGGGGGQGFKEKLPGGSPYFVFHCFFINKFFENLPGGAVSSPHPLPCASVVLVELSFFKLSKLSWHIEVFLF